jgi:glc operon protein GlcG
MYQTYNLSHADAAKIIDAIRQELEKEGKGACIAVADAHGELLAFLRLDNSPLPPINVSINKAFTAARERTETYKISERLRENSFPMSNFGDPRYISWGGGVPVIYQGKVIGGVGVSGLPEEEDMVVAAKGVNALIASWS